MNMPSDSQALCERQKDSLYFTWAKQSEVRPYQLKKAKGVHLEFQDGHTALDFSSHIFNANLGHGHEGVRQALIRAAQESLVTHPNLIHEEKAKLGENLRRITPKGLCKTFLSLSGSEANENAIKIARLYTGKTKIITRYRSYHGATLATLCASGDYRRIPFDGAFNGVVRFPDPREDSSGQSIDTVRLLEEIIEIEGPETIACILLEGITGANGVFIPPKDYFQRIRKLCDENNILLISDEIMSGFGRTGKWFGIDHFDVSPDIMTLGKGMTGGYAPLAATVTNKKIADFFDNNTLWCGLTNYGPISSCAAANAAIAAFEQDGLINNSKIRGIELSDQLKALCEDNLHVSKVRSIGLLGAIELINPSTQKPIVPYRATGDDAKKVRHIRELLYAQGVEAIVRFSTILIAPPLCISKDELALGMSRVRKALQNL